MVDINFSKKMSTQRPFRQSSAFDTAIVYNDQPQIAQQSSEGHSSPDDAHQNQNDQQQRDDAYRITRIFESDRGRILNSAALRRLQQKTQVFPLERNASVRSRLTHSMEVQQVGRYIAKEILNRLSSQNRLAELNLLNYQGAFESLIEMACLMHDIGNPPFGHFGEAAINNWFAQHLDDANQQHSPIKQYLQAIGQANTELKQKICRDLGHFEGNAQGIRIVYTLQKLNLTYAQTACILKYTRPAYLADDDIPLDRDYLMKKPGYYLSEEPFVKALWQELEMNDYSRHPLTYIMEAADDISYCIADLEDAVEKSILTTEQLYLHLQAAWQERRGSSQPDDLFANIVLEAKNRSLEAAQTHYRTKNDQFFMTLRVETVNALVSHVADRFIAHLPQIYAGEFNQPILGSHGDKSATESEECSLLEIYKSVAFQYVFCHEEVEQLELQGYRILTGLLDIYSPILAIPFVQFSQLVQQNKHKDYPIETRLFHKLSAKHRQAYLQAIEPIQQLPMDQQLLWEFYYRCRLIQDYISGMTDHYAYDEFRKLNAINL